MSWVCSVLSCLLLSNSESAVGYVIMGMTGMDDICTGVGYARTDYGSL